LKLALTAPLGLELPNKMLIRGTANRNLTKRAPMCLRSDYFNAETPEMVGNVVSLSS
jgi:hypothetical protein